MFEEIQKRKKLDLHRTLRTAGDASEKTRIDSDEMLVMGSNNYLGLTKHPRLTERASEAAERYGTGSGASRLVSGHLEIHDELEKEVAELKSAEDALVFSSGYATNAGVISALTDERDVIFSDELNHASIIDGCRLSGARVKVYDHCDTEELRKKYHETDARRKLVVTDSVFSMDGDIAPLEEICEIARDDYVMVDEAHATGIFGDEGAGVVSELGLSDEVDIQMGTFSKALGSQGGFIATSSEIVDLLVNEARSFVFSTGLSPIDAGVSHEAIKLVRSDEGDRLRHELDENVERLKSGLRDAGYDLISDESQITPVLVGRSSEAVELDAELEKREVFAPAIRPPTVPDGTSRIRVSAMATHSEEDIDNTIEAFEEAGKEVGVI